MNMYGSAEFDVSRTGVLVCRRRPGGTHSVIHWLDQTGKISPLLADPAKYVSPRISRDGSRLAFFIYSGGQRDVQDLRVFEWRTGKTLKVTTGRLYSSPVWTPDGRFLVAAMSGGIGGSAPMVVDLPDNMINSRDAQVPWSFDGRGQRLAFYQRGLSRSGSVTFDLWTVPVRISGDSITAGTPEPFVVSDAFEVYPAFSPDGRWIAYTSLESGGYEVYVRAFPDNGRTSQVSSGGGVAAVWSRDGRHLFYRTTEQRIMVVDYRERLLVSSWPAAPLGGLTNRRYGCVAKLRSRSRRANRGAHARSEIQRTAGAESCHARAELPCRTAPARPVNNTRRGRSGIRNSFT